MALSKNKEESVSDVELSNRRNFMSRVCQGVSAAAIGSSFVNLTGRLAHGEMVATPARLSPVADSATGLPMLRLPDGFEYSSFGWTNETMSDGTATPGAHDGMAVVKEEGDLITLIRNHEVGDPGEAFGAPEKAYDRQAAGGCTTLTFNRASKRFENARVSLSGTVKNCAGGSTPWGSWLSCEESVDDAKTVMGEGVKNTLTREHGYVFEVPADGQADAKPIKGLGRFVHEAVTIDPATGIVYLTEDRGTAGLYRFIPNERENLHAGGMFQMMCSKQAKQVRQGVPKGKVYDVYWVEIPDPQRAHSPGTQDELGVYTQGKELGGLTFARLEGCDVHDGKVFVTATSGGNAEAGQVWEYDPKEEQLKCIFESPSTDVLDMPDNMAVRTGGGILLCEDGDHVPQRLQFLNSEGRVFPFAANNMELQGLHGHSGDFKGSEMAGATFSADGEWLFVNVQTPGVTFAITGPWSDLPL